jgi:hypothetical protein
MSVSYQSGFARQQIMRTLCPLPRPSPPLPYAVHLPPQASTPVHTHAPNPQNPLHLLPSPTSTQGEMRRSNDSTHVEAVEDTDKVCMYETHRRCIRYACMRHTCVACETHMRWAREGCTQVDDDVNQVHHHVSQVNHHLQAALVHMACTPGCRVGD